MHTIEVEVEETHRRLAARTAFSFWVGIKACAICSDDVERRLLDAGYRN